MINPKLSVVLPAHRFDSYIIMAIGSVLAQNFNEFELIVILNGESVDFQVELENKVS